MILRKRDVNHCWNHQYKTREKLKQNETAMTWPFLMEKGNESAPLFHHSMTDQPADTTTEPKPLSERLTDKLWKTRLAAYTELKGLIETSPDAATEFVPSFKAFVTDVNASALEAGLQAVVAYLAKAPVPAAAAAPETQKPKRMRK